MSVTPTVFIVDDDPAIRKSTAMLLFSAKIPYETYDSAAAYLNHFDSSRCGCLLLDLSMPQMSGMSLIHRLGQMQSKLPIIVMTGTGTVANAVEGMRAGVFDFLEKPTDPEALIAKIRTAFEVDAAQRSHAEAMGPVVALFESLTPRQKGIVALLSDGLSSKQIARQLNLSFKTVDNHRTKIMHVTHALNGAHLASMWRSVNGR